MLDFGLEKEKMTTKNVEAKDGVKKALPFRYQFAAGAVAGISEVS